MQKLWAFFGPCNGVEIALTAMLKKSSLSRVKRPWQSTSHIFTVSARPWPCPIYTGAGTVHQQQIPARFQHESWHRDWPRSSHVKCWWLLSKPRGAQLMLDQCCSIVHDAGPTWNQHRLICGEGVTSGRNYLLLFKNKQILPFGCVLGIDWILEYRPNWPRVNI